MGKINITAEKVKVFAKEKTASNGNSFKVYSVAISTKKQDGSWDSIYLPVRFKKGINLADKTVININSAFPSFDPKNKQYPFWFIMDFDVVEEGETSDFVNLNDDLPFA